MLDQRLLLGFQKKEHEKEVQNRKRGKRPGAPSSRNQMHPPSPNLAVHSLPPHLPPEDDSYLDFKRSPWGFRKKAQVLVAKPKLKDPIRKKPGHKPLPPEQKTAHRPVSLAKVLKNTRKDLGSSAIKLPPSLSAPVAGLAALKAHTKEACGSTSTMVTPENLTSLMKDTNKGDKLACKTTLPGPPVMRYAVKCIAPSSEQEGHTVQREGRKLPVLSEMSMGSENNSSDSDPDSSSLPIVGQNLSVAIQTSQDWKPTRSLIKHVFVTDVTANLITVTMKKSPTRVGFFNLRHY